MAGTRTRAVDRHGFENYLKKASQHREAMELCFDNRLWNACAVNAIHCAISATDALTVFYLGFRHAGERHQDVLQILHRLDIESKELRPKINQLAALLSIKNIAEYEERLMDEKDAASAKKACERYHSWVKSKLI